MPKIISQVADDMVYPNYANGTVEPVTRYFIEGEPTPFLTYDAPAHILRIRQETEESREYRMGLKQAAE